jgi:Domain of unknown function (DUF4157)
MLIPTPGSRAHADYIQRQADLTAQGWVQIGSRKYLEPPPKGHEAYQRYVDLQAEAETRAQNINPGQLSTRALDPKVQAQLETVLGRLPTIQIAIGVDADAQSQAIGAVAFTSGSTIAFRYGKFNPSSLEGFKLLLHEATHVKQQASGQVSSGGIDPDANLERAAQQQADNLSQIPEIPQITHLEGKDITRDQHIANYSQQLIDRHDNLGPTKDRFEQMRDFFWQVPEDFQSRSRFNFMSGFSLASHEFLQLDTHLRTFRAGGLEIKQQIEAERAQKLEQQQAIKTTRAAMTFQTQIPRADQVSNPTFRPGMTQFPLSAGAVQRKAGDSKQASRRIKQSTLNRGEPGKFIRAEPATAVVVPGTKVNYRLDQPPAYVPTGWKDPRKYQWRVHNDPKSIEGSWVRPAIYTGPSKPFWDDAKWDFEGKHKLELTITEENGDVLIIEYTVRVQTIERLANDSHKEARAGDYIGFRTQVEWQALQAGQMGVKDQSAVTTISSNGSNPAPAATFITASNPPPNHTYTIKPSPNAKNWRWYAEPSDWKSLPTENLYGYTTKTVNGKRVYAMKGTGTNATFVMAVPNVYTITCEELDSSGKVIKTAQYRQVVLDGEQKQAADAAKKYTRDIDAAIKGTQEGKDVALKAVLVEEGTANRLPLNLFIGLDAKDSKTLRMVDLTPGAERRNFTGGSVEAVFDAFDSGNEYPKGQMVLEVPAN